MSVAKDKAAEALQDKHEHDKPILIMCNQYQNGLRTKGFHDNINEIQRAGEPKKMLRKTVLKL